jgi:hypothetical protein
VSARQWYGGPLPLGSRLPVPDVLSVVGRAMDEAGFTYYAPASATPVCPVVVPAESYRELFGAAVALLRLLRRALLETAPSAAGRIAALGADSLMYPLVMDHPAEEAYATCMARPDVMVDATGPKFMEFNIGGGFGGVIDTSLNTAAWTAAFGGPGRAPFTGPDTLSVRDELFLRAAGELGAEPAVVIVGTTRDLKGRDPSQYFEIQLASMRKHGLRAEFFEPEDLLAGLGSLSAPRFQLGLRHFTVPEWREYGIDLAPVRAALDAGCTLIASQTAYLVANKKVLGWISEGRPWMTDGDRDIVARYLPWTRVVSDRTVSWQGRQQPLPELLLADPGRFVLKPATGMRAQNVVVGRRCDPQLWKAAVERAVPAEDYIVQEYVEAVPYRMEFSEDGSRTFEAEVFPVFSPFVFGNRPGGCMIRYLPPGQHDVVGIYGHRAVALSYV